MIPLFKVFMANDCAEKLKDVFASGYIGEGEIVKEFEKELKSVLMGGHVVTTNSATAALHLAYQITGISGGEVITSPMTCMAMNTPIIHNGGKIVWADIDPETGNISIDSVREKFNSRTKAVVCVHYGGNVCNPELLDFCRSKGVPLIEDCAHLCNAGIGGIECYSFQAIKFLTTGDGGALVTHEREIADRARLLRWYGIDRTSGADMRCLNPVWEVGHKFHMNNISAMIGLRNLRHLPLIIGATHHNANHYNTRFCGLKTIKIVRTDVRNDYWLYVLLVDKDRDGFMSYMKNAGIATSLVHARNDVQPIFKDSKCKLPNLDKFWAKQVCIPVGWWVSEKDAQYIADKVCEYEKVCAC